MEDRLPDSSEKTKNFLRNLPLPLPKHFYELDFRDTTEMANTLTLEGESCLRNNDEQQAFKLFDQAIKVGGENAELLYRQAKSLFEFGLKSKQVNILRLASKKLKRSALHETSLFDVWFLLGKTLFELGELTCEKTFYLEAEKRMHTAQALSSNLTSGAVSELFSQLAYIQSKLAEFSKEAIDWQVAIDHYQKAASTCESLTAIFWENYGKACLALSKCINDVRLCVKGIYFFKHALTKEPSSPSQILLQIAKALEHLYQHTHELDHLDQTCEYFEKAIQAEPTHVSLYVNYTTFLIKSAKKTRDKKKLKTAIAECRKCHEIDPNYGKILGLWGEALSLLGELSDRLDLILEGLNKIEEAYDLRDIDCTLSYNHGQALNSLAKYYNDIEYRYQAIERFQEGLSQDRSLDHHWYAIAENYQTIGCADLDEQALGKALRFYLKAYEICPNNTYYNFAVAKCLANIGEITDDPQKLEQAVFQFTNVLCLQKNAIYLHPEWLFDYAKTLDLLGYYNEEDHYYTKALELLAHIMLISPDFKGLKYQMAVCFSHLGELNGDIENFYKALHYFKVAQKQDDDNDMILVDIGVTHINISQTTTNPIELETSIADAEYKLMQAAKAGNISSYYQLGCLFSLKKQYSLSLHFLEKAKRSHAMPSLEEVLEDEWLDNLIGTQEGKDFLTSLENN